MTNRQRVSSRKYPTHPGGGSSQIAAHEHHSEPEDIRRALQTPNSATLTPHVVRQLQRDYGNQSVLQLLRHHNVIAQPKRPQPVLTVARQRIQRHRLVEMQGQKDEKDFNLTRSQVEAGLGVASSGDWLKNTAKFDVGPTEDLFIWGHMTPRNIGGWEFYELAKLMIDRGFRGCATIRLIGCNDAGNYGEAPKTLYEELEAKFQKKATKAKKEVQDFPYTLTPIYATKGPLHSGKGSDVYALEDWFVNNTEEIENELNDKLNAVQDYIDGDEQEKPEDFKGRFFENKFDAFFDFAQMSSRIFMKQKIPPTKDQDDYDVLRGLFAKMMEYKKYDLKESDYPTLKRPVKDSQTGAKEWNPAAWTNYP